MTRVTFTTLVVLPLVWCCLTHNIQSQLPLPEHKWDFSSNNCLPMSFSLIHLLSPSSPVLLYSRTLSHARRPCASADSSPSLVPSSPCFDIHTPFYGGITWKRERMDDVHPGMDVRCGTWHSSHISPKGHTHTHPQLPHRHALASKWGFQQNQGTDQKSGSLFYEVQVIKLLAELVLRKKTIGLPGWLCFTFGTQQQDLGGVTQFSWKLFRSTDEHRKSAKTIFVTLKTTTITEIAALKVS